MPLRRLPTPTEPFLLVTTTREPFQPVRLYYEIPSQSFATKRLSRLSCVVEDRADRCWQWQYKAEAQPLKFFAGYDAVPPELQPIVLGRLRFPKAGGMLIELNSFSRAIEAARFFGRVLGPRAVLRRGRVVNRCFAASDGHPDELMRELDRDVTVIDPSVSERELEEDLKGVTSQSELERVAQARMQKRLDSKEDVPPVEDFPLAPEEETPKFDHLAMTLQLRMVRAMEHWRGQPRTLTEIIVDLVNNGQSGGAAR